MSSAQIRGPRRITVVGTGTGIGKTHVGVALVSALAARGCRVCGMKPIESGVTEGVRTDGVQLAEVSAVPPGRAPFGFEPPVSPHLAARQAGVDIALGAVKSWVEAQEAEVQVVETAGALLSPLGARTTNLDLTRALQGQGLVLVGVDRLGVLHEVAACRLALRVLAPELPAPVVVLNAPEVEDASTGSNAGELQVLGIAEVVVEMPRGDARGAGARAAAEAVLARLEGRGGKSVDGSAPGAGPLRFRRGSEG